MPNSNAIPDPRRYAQAPGSALVDAAARIAALAPAAQHTALPGLRERIAHLLAQGDEAAVRAALTAPGSRAVAALLFDALGHALAPPPALAGVHTRVFALPVLLVAGAQARRVVPGIVPEVASLAAVFEKAGALGHARNFGFSNALTSLDSLEAVPWARLYRSAHGAPGEDIAGFDLPPADIVLERGDESVHLRFLAGAMVTPADAPGFVETGADIGRWGMAFTRALAAQLATEGASLLPIARPPADFLRAARGGLFAARELGLQLFLSNALRQARARAGDPDATIAAYDDASVRVRLTSVFDDLFDRTYVWPLTALDHLPEVTDSILGLLAECRLDRVEVIDKVLPASAAG